MYYVYLHKSNDDVVYVGMTANLKRPYNMSNRQPEYKSFIDKNDISVEVWEVGSKKDARILELELIEEYKNTVFNVEGNPIKPNVTRTFIYVPNEYSNKRSPIHWEQNIDDVDFMGWKKAVNNAIDMGVEILKYILYIKEINIYKTNR